MTAGGSGVSFGGNESVLKFLVITILTLNILKAIEL